MGTQDLGISGWKRHQRKVTDEQYPDAWIASKVTGMAHVAAWPGDAEISNGKMDGDRVTFTVIGKLPWTAGSGGVTTSGFYVRSGRSPTMSDLGQMLRNWPSGA